MKIQVSLFTPAHTGLPFHSCNIDCLSDKVIHTRKDMHPKYTSTYFQVYKLSLYACCHMVGWTHTHTHTSPAFQIRQGDSEGEKNINKKLMIRKLTCGQGCPCRRKEASGQAAHATVVTQVTELRTEGASPTLDAEVRNSYNLRGYSHCAWPGRAACLGAGCCWFHSRSPPSTSSPPCLPPHRWP